MRLRPVPCDTSDPNMHAPWWYRTGLFSGVGELRPDILDAGGSLPAGLLGHDGARNVRLSAGSA